MAAQGGKCAACGDPMDPDAPPNSPLYPTRDHIVLHCQGGSNGYTNILLKHARCNRRRGAQPPNRLDFCWLRRVARWAANNAVRGEHGPIGPKQATTYRYLDARTGQFVQ